MFETLKYEEFREIKNSNFTVLGFDQPYSIELSDVSENKMRNGYEMFSLFFTSPKEYFLPQQTYKLKHEKFGEGEMFIVPIEQNDSGFLYQAVFNRKI